MKPNNFKFPKCHKGGRLNPAIKFDFLRYGQFALVACQPAIILASQLESVQLAIKRVIKKEGSLYFRIFPHTPVTKKPSEVRMGKGKGNVDHHVAKVQRGSIILEIKTNNSPKALTALKVAKSKLPLTVYTLTPSTSSTSPTTSPVYPLGTPTTTI
jgi:large subunit ribosomal protein L16